MKTFGPLAIMIFVGVSMAYVWKSSPDAGLLMIGVMIGSCMCLSSVALVLSAYRREAIQPQLPARGRPVQPTRIEQHYHYHAPPSENEWSVSEPERLSG